MLEVTVCKDLEKAAWLWQRHWPCSCLFDLWPVRACFQDQFNHRPHFIVATERGQFRGMVALSWIEEMNYFGHFPGELWQGQTWLEQNKIVAADSRVARALLDQVPEEARIRYLSTGYDLPTACRVALDETGYLFFPAQYNHCFQAYYASFSGRTRKKMRGALERLKARGVQFRYNHWADLDEMFRLNLERYQGNSYFDDTRFLRAFERLAAWLSANNLLRITTVLVDGTVAAVDMGAVWNSTYSVMAGGTNAEFPDIAKLINLHHLEWACAQKINMVDFLCGEFNWKDSFRLAARPLYVIEKNRSVQPWAEQVAYNRREVCVA
jgi:hypothetical protein